MIKVRPLAAVAIACLLATAGCKGKGKNKGDSDRGKPVEGHPTEVTRPDPPPAPEPVNDPPTMEIPRYDVVGVGQEIGFGIEVVDEESDEITVELIAKPESASWDPYTLTVVWKPTAADMPQGEFAVKITERRRDIDEVRINTHRFSIAVSPRAQPLPVAKPLGAAVETLITIHDPERLALANKKWPFDAMLEAAARSAHNEMGDKGKDIQVASREELYKGVLHNLARTHHNKTVEPSAPEFDKATWGNPADWKIIAIRPRLDKKGHEVRIVYKAKSHAATYAMFKFRPLAHHHLPAGGLEASNKALAELVVDSFFTDKGELDPALFRDKAAHAKKVAAFLDGVINYKSSEGEPSVTFLGMPTEARLGGGNKRDAEGNYASGDAWAWAVMKAKAEGDKVVLTNVAIKGFLTDVVAKGDKSEWVMQCASLFDPESDAHEPRLAGLCRDTGHVDLPGAGDGYQEAGSDGEVVSSKIDAVNRFIEHKTRAMVETVPLRDPRRDLFEEKGMTCSQCHVRQFGVRDFYDPGATDPKAGEPRALNKKQDTTYFVIAPVVGWQPYMIDFQDKQECKIKAAIKKALGLDTSLTCPLKAE